MILHWLQLVGNLLLMGRKGNLSSCWSVCEPLQLDEFEDYLGAVWHLLGYFTFYMSVLLRRE